MRLIYRLSFIILGASWIFRLAGQVRVLQMLLGEGDSGCGGEVDEQGAQILWLVQWSRVTL